MKKIFLKSLKAYQYISKFTPASCRYYPTCSEYAKWLYIFDTPLNATLKSIKRVTKCNQLFPGGVDYPSIKYKKPKLLNLINIKQINRDFYIQFWIVPKDTKNFFLLKDLYETNFKKPS